MVCTRCLCHGDPGTGHLPARPSLRLSSSEHSPSCSEHSGGPASSVWPSVCSCSVKRDRAVGTCPCTFPWSWGSDPWGCLSCALPSLLGDHQPDSAPHALGSCLSLGHSSWAALGVVVWATACSANWETGCGPPSSCLPAIPNGPMPVLLQAGGQLVGRVAKVPCSSFGSTCESTKLLVRLGSPRPNLCSRSPPGGGASGQATCSCWVTDSGSPEPLGSSLHA